MKNILLNTEVIKQEILDFNKLQISDYQEAITHYISNAEKEIEMICSNKEEPNFSNTIEGIENIGLNLDKVTAYFFNLNYANTSTELQKASQEISPALSDFSNSIYLNSELFEKVKKVYAEKESLDLNTEQNSLLENCYQAFIRTGIGLSDKDKAEYKEISKKLSKLSLQFQENVLATTNDFQLHLTNEADISGIPSTALDQASKLAKENNKEGWIFTLHFPSYMPFIKYADNRELRKVMHIAYSSRCFDDKYCNKNNIKEIVNLRLRKAQLLGYKNYADYVLEMRMAKSSKNVNEFLEELLNSSIEFAKQDLKEVQEFAKSIGFKDEIQKWDWAYFSEKLLKEKYSIDDELTRPYFKLENVIAGVFDLANKLYDIRFEIDTSLPKYHRDVLTYRVYDKENNFLSYFYADFHPRPEKQGGAWMTSFTEQYINNGTDHRPHVSIVCNFIEASDNRPSLLSFSEFTTLLHEFGHALHGMLTRCTYRSLSGTNVFRDFVELPSQFMENFAFEKQWIVNIAKHYQTEKAMPSDMIDNIIKSANFQSGYQFTRQISFGLNDMAWHSIEAEQDFDIIKFENDAMAKTDLFESVENTCMSTAFSHIFGGGYAAGYYGYKWAEVLDADAFEAFKENGIFDKKTADLFRENILETGSTESPEILYRKFRGRDAKIDALLKRSGLVK
ncbi:MAG: M3 family metallopeptidase [Marinifilaceae bacterium]|jgi:peptidyl-dipeptidase Dcp|nr:M3 family metallopeptidase [Marinifilaceae bacterium]